MPHIDGVRDMNSFERMEFRAKCRFLRAYAYYLILQQNGPMILLGDEIVSNNEEAEYYARTRNTYDECVDYICSEFDEAAKNLPDATTSMDQYIPTEGAALALAARVRLQVASPLYNGGEATRRFLVILPVVQMEIIMFLNHMMNVSGHLLLRLRRRLLI
ncbi:RagB/SusD family nutrient uptake outer membrane protein [Bacteroides thetaiotaomicron]|nr:RagB/SusD family nutrient uptake outer membrane protein [Bacteroides thetaiotaomicron]